MGTRLQRLLSAAVILTAAKLIRSYSYNNCIEDSYSKGTKFSCINRKAGNLSSFINDLPPSAVTLTICNNNVRRITDQSFVNLPQLQDLRLDRNELEIIDQLAFQSLHQLQSLNLSFNSISQLRPDVFKDLSNLTYLSLTSNRLKQLPEVIFSTLVNLNTLIMRQNFLSNFSSIVQSVSHLTNLSRLDLCANNLTSLSNMNASLPKSVSTLYVCTNDLHTLGCQNSFLRSIRLLDLSNNSRLPTMAFQGVDLRNLNYLRLRNTSVHIVEFINISNISPSHVDFSGTGIKTARQLSSLCVMLKKKKAKSIKNFRLSNNGIKSLTRDPLRHCPNIRGSLDLSRNHLRPDCLAFLQSQIDVKTVNAEHNLITSLPTCNDKHEPYFAKMEELSYRYNRILSVNSNAFINTPNLKTLKLNINTIAFLDKNALKGLKQLQNLRLDNNLLTDLYKSTFEDLINLQTLNLRNNRISVIFSGTFHSLRNLTILDLGGNKIASIQPSGLIGLVSLSKFYLDGNNLKKIDSSLYFAFQDTLTVLDLKGNQISFNSERSSSPFMKLRKLRDLKLDEQQPHGLIILPSTLFRGLYSLKSLYLTNNHISRLDPQTFDDLTDLNFLTLSGCCAGVTELQPGIFKNLGNLTKLIIENMGIQNFSKEVFKDLKRLHTLQLNHNVMQSIPVEALESLSKLRYLDIRNIPLSCSCTNSILQNYTLLDQRVQVAYLYHLPCHNELKQKFYNFDTRVCYIDLGEYLFVSTAVVIFLFTVTPLLYVKLYWKMKYSYYVFRAWFSEQWSRIREVEENCKYDAFISYNSSDEQWVMNELLPNMEGNGSSFKLCLHHRDFELGRDIVDNIVSAVYSSRKTVCVVSRNFLQSEWCSLEIQLASYRLFDEHRDVLLLVFLEPISERQLSSYHRMRKVMLKKTYLQWPSSNCTDPLQAQELFWNHLRRAMKTGSRLKREEIDESKSCAYPEIKENQQSENYTSDENYYLLP